MEVEDRLCHHCAMSGEVVEFAFANVNFDQCQVDRRSRDRRHWEFVVRDGAASAPLRRVGSFYWRGYNDLVVYWPIQMRFVGSC